MDTNITDRAEIQVEDGEETLPRTDVDLGEDRLRAFRTMEAGDRLPRDPQITPPGKTRRRNGLMIGVSSIVVLAAAAGIFWISPYNHYTLRDATNLATHMRDVALNTPPKPAPPIAPAAQLARAPEPTAPPLRFRPQPPGSQPISGGDDMAEFLRLGSQGPSLPSVATPPIALTKPAQVAVNLPSVNVVKPKDMTPPDSSAPAGQIPAHPSAAPTEHPVEPATPEAKPAASHLVVSAPVPAPAAPQDAIAKIAALRPAPMTEPQQLQVLQLVTELGTLVRDQRVEISQLRQDQQNLGQRVDSSMADFGRRLSLAEARGAVSAAMGVPTTPIPPAASVPNQADVAPKPPVIKASVQAAAPPDMTPHRYHVQAASPGLAMLTALDPSGGEEQQLPVAPGDTVPGWGKVISISQSGATWVVKTDHGLIQ